MSEITIDTVCTKGSLYPMLISFQNGYPSEDFESECEILQDNDTKVIATELDELVYYGKEEKEDLGQTLILARDRNTGKVRLIEVGCLELIPYRKVDLDSSQLLETSRLELSRKFGSKKHKKQMEQREKLKVNVETVTAQMETVTANVTADQLDLSQYNTNDSEEFYIPPIDRDATKVEEVYSLDKIMSDLDYDSVYTELKEANYQDFYHPYIKLLIKNRTLSQKLMVLAAYASELIKFIHVPLIDVKKKDYKFCKFSETLNKIGLKTFTEIQKGKRMRSQQMKDKVICHIMVFVLLINHFKFDFEPLCAAVKISPKTQTNMNKVRLIGAHIVYEDGVKRVHLKLPLVPKPVTLGRRKSSKF